MSLLKVSQITTEHISKMSFNSTGNLKCQAVARSLYLCTRMVQKMYQTNQEWQQIWYIDGEESNVLSVGSAGLNGDDGGRFGAEAVT